LAKAKSLLIVFLFFVTASAGSDDLDCDGYNRDAFKEERYKLCIKNGSLVSCDDGDYPEATKGFYTGRSKGEKDCEEIHKDHVVSLKEAFCRGLPEKHWSDFANDRENHVAACESVNLSKKASTPKCFLKRSCNGEGKEYSIVRWKEYLDIYYMILEKYDLLAQGEEKVYTLKESVCP